VSLDETPPAKPVDKRSFHRWLVLEGMRRAREGRRFDARRPMEWQRGWKIWHRMYAQGKDHTGKPPRFPRMIDLAPIRGTQVNGPCRYYKPVPPPTEYVHVKAASAPRPGCDPGQPTSTVQADAAAAHADELAGAVADSGRDGAPGARVRRHYRYDPATKVDRYRDRARVPSRKRSGRRRSKAE
jgi:hypothetical protein